MLESGAMLTIWRRHTAECPHRAKGRDYLKCECPLWADGYIDGRRTLRQSLKTRDMARARKRAVLIESPDGQVYKPLADAIAAYLVNCQHLNTNTQRKYRNRLQKQLQPFCERKGIDAVSELSTEALDEFSAGRKLALTTSARELETLRQFLAFCEARRWISDNPAKRIKTPKNIKPEPVVPYTAAEVEKMLEAAALIGNTDYERLRARAMVLLLRHTALRISDVALLERARIEDSDSAAHPQDRRDDSPPDSERAAGGTRSRAGSTRRGPQNREALFHKRGGVGAHVDQRCRAVSPRRVQEIGSGRRPRPPISSHHGDGDPH